VATAVRPVDECQTLTVVQAARVLGISRWAAYDAARRGEIPTIRIGDRVLVSKPALDEMLRGATAG
jgi:excisionase family DNA binding protein